MDPRPNHDRTPTLPVVRCILWHVRGSPLPGPLVAALDRPGVQWKAWDSDLLTLAELVRPNAAPDPLTHDARAKVVVLVDPSRLVGLSAVLDTIERYRPGTPLWVYEGGTTPRLAGMTLAEARTRFGEAPATPAPAPAAPVLKVVTRSLGPIVPRPIAPARAQPITPPPLRLTTDDAPPPPAPAGANLPDDPDQDDRRPGVPLLSEEEIEMLLSDPPPKGTPGGKGGTSGTGRGGSVR